MSDFAKEVSEIERRYLSAIHAEMLQSRIHWRTNSYTLSNGDRIRITAELIAQCPVCGQKIASSETRLNYCPECGARLPSLRMM